MERKIEKKRTLKLGGVPFFPPCDIYQDYYSGCFKRKKPPKGPRNISPVKEPPIPLFEMPPVRAPGMPPLNYPEDPSQYTSFV